MLHGDWNEDFLKEFADFPDGENDDQVDTCAIGYNTILNIKIKSPSWGRGKALNPERTKVYAEKTKASIAVGATWGGSKTKTRFRIRTGVAI